MDETFDHFEADGTLLIAVFINGDQNHRYLLEAGIDKTREEVAKDVHKFAEYIKS